MNLVDESNEDEMTPSEGLEIPATKSGQQKMIPSSASGKEPRVGRASI